MGTFVPPTTKMESIDSLTRHVVDNFVHMTASHSDAAELLEQAQIYYNMYESCLTSCTSEGHDVSSYQPNLAIIETWITDTLGGTVETIFTSVEITNPPPTA